MARRFRVVRRKRNQVEIIGLDFRAAPRTQWRRALDDFGRMLQTLIAKEFADEKVAGQHLRRNSPAYNAWKRKKGFDPRKGHKTNALQRALAGRRLYTINFVAGGRAFVTFIESRLYTSIDYAQYYAASKVQGGKILAVSKRQVDRAAMQLEAFAVRVSRDANTAIAAGARGVESAVRVGGSSTLARLTQGRTLGPTGLTPSQLAGTPARFSRQGMPTSTAIFQNMTTQNRARVAGAVSRLNKIINSTNAASDAAKLERLAKSMLRRGR